MKLLVQRPGTPRDWEQHDSSDWNTMPMSRVQALCVQGVVFEGKNWYAVEHRGEDCVVWALDDNQCYRWYFEPLQPDPQLGGAMNTRQHRQLWNTPNHDLHLPTAAYRPGLRTDRAFDDNRNNFGWRDWGKDGRVPDQRALGKYSKSQHTITFYHRTSAAAMTAEAYFNEKSLKTTTQSPTGEITREVEIAATEETHLFWANVQNCNSADWPNGSYRSQWDCTVADLGITWTGKFYRFNAAGTVTLESWDDADLPFAGTGLKLSTSTQDPAAGSTTDRYGVGAVATNSSLSETQTFTLEAGSTDSFADGPWTGPAVPGAGVVGSMYYHLQGINR